MKKNILIFPCGSEIGLEIYRSLAASTHFNVIGGTSCRDHGKFVYQKIIEGVPFIECADFIDSINMIVKNNNIDLIIPAHDSAVLKLSKAYDEGVLACAVVTSPYATAKICRSKKLTYEVFEGIIKTPVVYNRENLEGVKYPLFLKPDVGQGSKGVYRVNFEEELNFYLQKDPSLLILEYLPGNEYTVDCFTNFQGELLYIKGRERVRIQNGISVNAIERDDLKFVELAKKINNKLKLQGAWFFQVKEREDKALVLMEIAPRIAGTMGFSRAKGVNLVLLSLFDKTGINVKIIQNNFFLEMDRALYNRYKHNIDYENVYIDLDDTLIVDNKISAIAIAFLYQCINKGIKIWLITKHLKDIQETLKKYKITGLFDNVIHLKESDKKYMYIKEKKSIFIDDSFFERYSVSTEKGIPVFDINEIEALIEF